MAGTWNSQNSQESTSTSSSSCDLNENDSSSILVYRYRDGLEVQSQQDLCKYLSKHPHHRVSRKRIPRGNSRIEVKTEDLYNEPERSAYQKFPNSKNSLASVGLPRAVYWKRLLLNQFQDLYIVSPESSPNSSPESSQNCSPSHTFHHNQHAQMDGERGEQPADR
ncbi:hypothetical protein H2201_007533 [Coniosporium apollinis]|uniref:Uncharacterized protein n=1 Tax=Coniosporium apollinis TaxID=61459 RepID=A0ABQ9NIL6_9PEZI|nr:hypothetical protein H2201_007533 [Coniosporium apollinis]